MVYDLCEMKVIGEIFIDLPDACWFPVSAQMRNMIVFSSTRANYVFDLDTVASTAASGSASRLPPLARFPPPLPIDNKHYSAELIGDRLVFVLVCNEKLHIYTCHFPSVLQDHGTEDIAWQKYVFALPFNNHDLHDIYHKMD